MILIFEPRTPLDRSTARGSSAVRADAFDESVLRQWLDAHTVFEIEFSFAVHFATLYRDPVECRESFQPDMCILIDWLTFELQCAGQLLPWRERQIGLSVLTFFT